MKIKITSIISVATGALLALTMLAPTAFAISTDISTDVSASVQGVGVDATASVKVSAAITKARDRANQEITRRVDALNSLVTRIGDMKNISASDKTNLTAQIQNQASVLTTLNTQIQAESSTTALKADVQSITDSYRVFILVIPQGRIYAAVDRIHTIFNDMTIIGAKLQARISVAQTSGADVTAAATVLADYNAKLSDAATNAQAAQSEVSTLTPDQGDQTKMTANANALKDARAKLKTTQSDLVAARKDIDTIRKDLPKVSASAAVGATTTVQNSQY